MDKVEATPLVQGPDISQDRDVDADAETATVFLKDQAATTVPAENPNAALQAPENRLQLSMSALATIPKVDNATKRWLPASTYDVGYRSLEKVDHVNKDGWTHIINKSCKKDARTAKVTMGSAVARSIFGGGDEHSRSMFLPSSLLFDRWKGACSANCGEQA